MAELMLLRNRALKAGAATGLALAAVLTAGGASHAAATGAQGDSTQTAELGVLASAPRFISGPEAQHVVSTKYSSARYDKKKASWKYTGSKIVVVLNNNGFCVTAWRR
jgi:hypothetical protein